MDTDNRDPISNLRAVASKGSALDLVQVERGNLRALVAEHRCLEAFQLSGVVGLREALEKIAHKGPPFNNAEWMRGIARAALNNTGGQSAKQEGPR